MLPMKMNSCWEQHPGLKKNVVRKPDICLPIRIPISTQLGESGRGETNINIILRDLLMCNIYIQIPTSVTHSTLRFVKYIKVQQIGKSPEFPFTLSNQTYQFFLLQADKVELQQTNELAGLT